MPFTLRNLRRDLEDVGPRFDGAPDLELLVFGAPSLGDARREDVEGKRDWWPDES